MPGMTATGVRKRIPSTLGLAFISLLLINKCAHREYVSAQGKQQCERSSTWHLSWPRRGHRAERRPLLGFLILTRRGGGGGLGQPSSYCQETPEFYLNSHDFKMLLQISEKHHMGQIKHGSHWPPVLKRRRGEVSPTSSAAALLGLGEEEGL